MKRFFAFTLAETLIVMGIIGIVSALTLPNLNASTGEKEKVAKVKKIYQNLNDAYGRATAIYGPLNEWFLSDTTEAAQKTRFYDRMTEFMKVSKSNAANWTATLADGTSLVIDHVTNSSEVRIDIDIDGENKGKNRDGVDLFHFATYTCADGSAANRIVDISSIVPHSYNGSSTQGSSTLLVSCLGGGGFGCTKWVIDYDNMDYLKLDSSGKCPNGKALNILANPPVVTCR